MDTDGSAPYILRIEHEVRDYNTWKKMFDKDPGNRRQGGVVKYRILQRFDNPNFVMVDLEFDDPTKMESYQETLFRVWGSLDKRLVEGPSSYLTKVTEEVQL